MTKLKILIAFVILLHSLNAWGETYYISNSVGDDSRTSAQAQSPDTPWQHMKGQTGATGNAASYTVSSGDIFVLKGGDTWVMGTTESTHISIQTAGVTVMGGQRCGQSGSESCNGGSAWGSGYPVIDGEMNMTVTTYVIEVGSYGAGKENVVIDGLKIYRTGNQGLATSDGNGTGISIIADKTSHTGTFLTIKNCWLETYGVNAIAIITTIENTNASGMYIYGNTFKHNGRVSISTEGADGEGHDPVFDDIQIYSNLFMGPGNPNSGGFNGHYFTLKSGGTGYSVNDVLTVVEDGASGGTLVVTEVNSGVITKVTTTGRGTGYTEKWGDNALSTTVLPSGGNGAKIESNYYHGDGFMVQAHNFNKYGITNMSIFNNKFYGDWTQGATATIYLSGATQFSSNTQCGSEGYASCSAYGTPIACCTGNGTGTCTDFANAGCTANAAPYGCCTGAGTGTCVATSLCNFQGPYSTQNTKIYNNIISYENTTSISTGTLSYVLGAGISVSAGGHSNVAIYNNTIDLDAYTSADVPECVYIGNVNGASIRNNIFSGATHGLVVAEAAQGTITYNNNLYDSDTIDYLLWDLRSGINTRCSTLAACQSPPVSQEANGISGTPDFTASPNGSVGSGDWSLQGTSDAIGKGVNLGSDCTGCATDYAGTTRGTVWDIGAYEYEAGSFLYPSVTIDSGAGVSIGSGAVMTLQ